MERIIDGRLIYKQILPFVFLIPGENASPFSLEGTNCVVLGQGSKRIMIDTCSPSPLNKIYLKKLHHFLQDQKCAISDLFITHHHPDHVGSIPELIELFPNLNIYKHLKTDLDPSQFMSHKKDNNQKSSLLTEKEKSEFLNHQPEVKTYSAEFFKSLDKNIKNIEDYSPIYFSPFKITPIESPGHCDDHISYLIQNLNENDQKNEKNETILLSGDVILGTPSTVINDYRAYMSSLQKLLCYEYNHIIVPHQVGEFQLFNKEKIKQYMSYREKGAFLVAKEGGSFQQIWQRVYGQRGLTGALKVASELNLKVILHFMTQIGVLKETSDYVKQRDYLGWEKENEIRQKL